VFTIQRDRSVCFGCYTHSKLIMVDGNTGEECSWIQSITTAKRIYNRPLNTTLHCCRYSSGYYHTIAAGYMPQLLNYFVSHCWVSYHVLPNNGDAVLHFVVAIIAAVDVEFMLPKVTAAVHFCSMHTLERQIEFTVPLIVQHCFYLLILLWCQ
jgi:hypothetical protein